MSVIPEDVFDEPVSYDEATQIYETREQKIASEMLKQGSIYRPGTEDAVLRRAAINALMERGEY